MAVNRRDFIKGLVLLGIVPVVRVISAAEVPSIPKPTACITIENPISMGVHHLGPSRVEHWPLTNRRPRLIYSDSCHKFVQIEAYIDLYDTDRLRDLMMSNEAAEFEVVIAEARFKFKAFLSNYAVQIVQNRSITVKYQFQIEGVVSEEPK
jgi:hypothetical protein